MKISKVLLMTLALGAGSEAFAYGLGATTHPLEEGKRLLNAEVTGIMKDETGVGAQLRYVQQMGQRFAFDAGVGVGGGERKNRIFAGGDYTVMMATEDRPTVSGRVYLENVGEYDKRRTLVGVAPTLSKGFNFVGDTVSYPFVALPLEFDLTGDENGDDDDFTWASRLAFGLTTPLPVQVNEEGSRLVANLEANINLRDGFSAVFAGVSYPFN